MSRAREAMKKRQRLTSETEMDTPLFRSWLHEKHFAAKPLKVVYCEDQDGDQLGQRFEGDEERKEPCPAALVLCYNEDTDLFERWNFTGDDIRVFKDETQVATLANQLQLETHQDSDEEEEEEGPKPPISALPSKNANKRLLLAFANHPTYDMEVNYLRLLHAIHQWEREEKIPFRELIKTGLFN